MKCENKYCYHNRSGICLKQASFNPENCKTLKKYKKYRRKNETLLEAAIKTLKDNLHLCDGDNCTLRELRDAVKKIEPSWEVKI